MSPDADVLARGGIRVDWTGTTGEPVVTITLDRPDTRNAQTLSTWRALRAVGDRLPAGTRAVVVRGAGPVFSSGIDLRSFTPEGVDGESVLTQFLHLDDAAASDLIAEFQSGFTWLHDRDDVITVAAVQGPAVGAGFQLALACDLRLCSSAARFAMRETTLGLVPDLTGTHPLVHAVGYSRAVEICVTGRWVSAEEAASIGLVTAVFAPDELESALADLVAALVTAPASAAAATKSVLRAAVGTDSLTQRRTERQAQIPLLRGLATQHGG
jgi:enoyl-CoA hydratase/carnithine racemase